MRDWSQPKEFEDDSMNHKEIYFENGLQIIYTGWDWGSYLLRTNKYSIVICERLNGVNTWDIHVRDLKLKEKLFEINTYVMPEFMTPLHGKNVRDLKHEDEVNSIVDKFIKLKVFI